jgi:hypothetical protein
MDNLDYFKTIPAPEAESLHQAFGISDERAQEMAVILKKGYNECIEASKNGAKLSKADTFLAISRAGFSPSNASELAFMTFMIGDLMANLDIKVKFAHVMPTDTVNLLFNLIEKSSECDCPSCKQRRGE